MRSFIHDGTKQSHGLSDTHVIDVCVKLVKVVKCDQILLLI